MSSTTSPVKAATVAAAELALLTAAVWVLRGYVWPTLSSVEVATLQTQLDPRLFPHDFAVQEALQFTPRYYYNELILLPAKLGLPLAWSFAAWHLVAIAVLLGSLRSLARSLGLGATATAALATWLLTAGIGTIGGVYFYTHAPVPAVWAGALVLCGAAQAASGRNRAAYACFGSAALIQFLVGFYAGLLALPLMYGITTRQRLAALGWWALGLALVYVPLLLNGGTDSGLLDRHAFVEVYAQLRLPHHLVPSRWGLPAWIQFVAFYAGAWWFLTRTASGRPAWERTLLRYTLGITACALVLNYLFIELYPLALVAKLQPARITPLAQGLVLTLLATRVDARAARHDWLGAGLLVLIPFSLFPGFLLALAAVLTAPKNRPTRVPWTTLVLAAGVLLAFQPFDHSFTARGIRYGLWSALFAVQLAPLWLRRRPFALAAAAASVVGGAGFCAQASLQPDWPRFLVLRFAVNAPPIDAPGLLGQRFGTYSPIDAMVLLPPAGETWSFKLHSQRAAVVDDKNSPFSERGLREWKERMGTVLGAPLGQIADPVAAWAARAPEHLRRVAAHYGARYILTRDLWHPNLGGRRIDQQDGWSLWELPPQSDK